MIKKTLLLSCLAFCVCFTFCKKQYSCQCATTFSSPGYSAYTVSSLEKIDKKTTKKRAELICAHAEKQIANNDKDYTSGTVTTSCALK